MRLVNGLRLYENFGDWIAVPTKEFAARQKLPSAFSLSESGAILWRMLEAGSDMESLVQRLLDEYSIDYETAFDDVAEFVQSLKKAGLLDDPG